MYLWFFGSRAAATAASTMWAGVGKSGSPAPKPMTGSPAALSALALASTASVADSAMAATRWLTRARVRGVGNSGSWGRDGVGHGGTSCDTAPGDRREDLRSRSLGPRRGPPSWPGDPPAPRHQDPRRPAARRRALRLRALEGPPRGRRGAGRLEPRLPRHLPPAGPGAVRGRGAPQRPGRALRPPRRLRGAARQRRHHLVLGRRLLRAHRSAQPAPPLRRVLVQVRRGRRRRAAPRRAVQPVRRSGDAPAPGGRPRGRHLLPHPQRDLHRCGHAARAARRCRRARHRRRHLGGRRSALRAERGRRLLLRPAEVPGVRRWPLARGGLARGHRPHRTDRGIGALGPRVPRPGHRPREQPQGPDLQHAGARHDLPGQPAGRVDQPAGRPRVGRQPLRPVRRHDLRLGRGVELRHPVRGRPGPAQPRRRHHRHRRGGRRRPHRLRASCATTASSTPRATASSAATSCASRCSRRSTPTTSPPSPAASTTSWKR